MPDSNRTFRVNGPRVVHEVIDGEVVAIDLVAGTYFSLRGFGAAMFDALARGASIAAVADAVSAPTGVERDTVEHDVVALTEVLEADGVLVAGVDSSWDGSVLPIVGPYLAPTVERFDDLQELIQLDPIHDVTTAGWPEVRDER